jgi:DNA-directed RNA polymerase subunit RPC12/RpoP
MVLRGKEEVMSQARTRYNSFILDKTGKYSCPSCYRLHQGKITTDGITCAYCLTKAPIYNPGPGAPAVISGGITVTSEFHIVKVDANYHYYQCPNCGKTNAGQKGLYAFACPNCIFAAPVSYREICNACLMGGHGLAKAEYICSNPAGRHSPGHNTGLKIAGKCASHKCHYDCKKI